MTKTVKTNSTLPALLGGVLLAALTGCNTYVEERPAAVYVAPPPAPVIVEAPPAPPPAVVVIQSDSDFYQPLAAYGQWVDVVGYGRVWRPVSVAPDWRPYANGHWQQTDAGWFWVSDEPFGWATYHYGRWDFAADLGWFWIPQTEWAPAWVAWRSGGGYTGWAPLPPREHFERGVRVAVDLNVVAPRSFVFVEDRHFTERHRPATVIVNNTEIVNRTVVLNHTTIVNKTVVINGPPVAQIEKSTGHAVKAETVTEMRHTVEAPVATHRPAAPPEVAQHPAATRPPESRPAPTPSTPKPVAPSTNRPQPPNVAQNPPAARPGENHPATTPAAPKPSQPEANRPRTTPVAPQPQAKPPTTAAQPAPRPSPAAPQAAPKPPTNAPQPPATKPGTPPKPDSKDDKKKPDPPK